MPLDISKIAGVVGLALILLFAIGITYDVIKKIIKTANKDDSSSDDTTLDIRCMIYFDLFLIFIHMIFITINFIFSSDDKHCNIITKLSTFFFHMTRLIMYLIFLRRIQVIYDDTIFQLKKLHSYILCIIIALYFIPYIFYFNWNIINSKYDENYGCLIHHKSSIIFLISSGLHIFIVIYCSYLFIHPLSQLIKEQQHNKHLNGKLYNVLIKYSILYSSSIFSSILLILSSYKLSFGYNYSIIDSLCNGIILILLHPIHNTLYKAICCCLHPLCIFICNAPEDLTIIQHTKSASITSRKSVQSKGIQIPCNTPCSPNLPSPKSPQTVMDKNKNNTNFAFPESNNGDPLNLPNLDAISRENSIERDAKHEIYEKPKLELTPKTATTDSMNMDDMDKKPEIKKTSSMTPSTTKIKDIMKHRAQNRFNSNMNDISNLIVFIEEVTPGLHIRNDQQLKQCIFET